MKKETLRSKLISIRDKTPAFVWESKAIADNLTQNYSFSKDLIIAGYWPIKNEASPLNLLSVLYDSGHTICLPEVISYSKILNFRRWCPYHPLQPGKFGTSQPWLDQPSLKPDVILTPLVGFDSKGTRLGYGGGYYDHTISNLKEKNGGSVIVLGVGREIQRVHAVPNTSNDQKLDFILTEENFERVT